MCSLLSSFALLKTWFQRTALMGSGRPKLFCLDVTISNSSLVRAFFGPSSSSFASWKLIAHHKYTFSTTWGGPRQKAHLLPFPPCPLCFLAVFLGAKGVWKYMAWVASSEVYRYIKLKSRDVCQWGLTPKLLCKISDTSVYSVWWIMYWRPEEPKILIQSWRAAFICSDIALLFLRQEFSTSALWSYLMCLCCELHCRVWK